MSPDKTIRMANQIATFFASRPESEGADGVAAHINDFWAPAMRAELLTLVEGEAAELHPLVRAAASAIRRPEPAGG